MADIRSTRFGGWRERPLLLPVEGGGEGLWGWVTFSGVLHVVCIIGLFLLPRFSSLRTPSYPVYTVDLVGGEKLGGTNLGSVIAPAPQIKKPAAKAESAPPRVEVAKKEKPKKVPVSPTAMREAATKKSKKEVKKEAKAEEGLSGQVREKLIQSALERVKNRVEGEQKKSSEEVVSSGPGSGQGAAALGSGGQGGGVVMGADFILYYNQMLRLIRERWTWLGKKSDLQATVHFGVQANGEITGFKIVRGSGDASYDQSVSRAVRGVSPLPPPPEKYQKNFMDVEITFTPKDLGR